MIKKIIILFFFIVAELFVSANPIKDLISKAGGKEDFPKANYIIIFDSTKVNVQETGLSYVNTHSLYKILTAKGAISKRVVKYGYDPLSAYVEIKKVVIYRKTGEIEILNKNDIKDYPAPARAIYWGAREKMLEVGRLNPGDAVEVFLFKKGFTYALLQSDDEDEKYIPPMRGNFYDIVPFWSSEPILTKVYQVNIPKDKFMQYEFYNGEVRSSIHFINDRTEYTFTKNNIKPMPKEYRMVALSDIAPKLLLSTSPDWKTKSLWFYNVNEDYGSFEFTPEIKAKVDEILQDAKTEMDSVSLLTHWVADEIRYSGISMGKGEGYTLHKGAMDFRDRCGVCKDKAGMLITMLRAAGFKAYPAMTMAGSRIDNIPADQFNHCVVVAKLSDKKYHLLDPTWVPFLRELWSSAEQQQNYLMGVPEGADLAITPISKPENHYLKINGNSEIFKNGMLKGEFTLTAEGQSDGSIRGLFKYYLKSDWKTNLEKELLKLSPLAKITNVDFVYDPLDYKAGPITFKITYEIPDYAFVTDEEIIFTPVVASNIFKRGNSHLYFSPKIKERKYPFKDRCSRLVELNETIKLPENIKSVDVPEEKLSDGTGAYFKGCYKTTNNTITLSETAKFKKRVYQPEDWESFANAVKHQNEFAKTPVIIKF
ncbi:MAG: DUF3857 domain-containing protein [Bacteroidales bacterium]|nr:DUF3857 domain-containing protein [Bacteroidales bacterium]